MSQSESERAIITLVRLGLAGETRSIEQQARNLLSSRSGALSDGSKSELSLLLPPTNPLR